MSSTSEMPDRASHPCFYAETSGRFGRIHLPVAPSCNIQCTYCHRDYDCPNENRPGVTTKIESPEEAAERLDRALTEMPYISVAAVAGPGDAFSEPQLTLKTFESIRRKNSDIALCVSTNGLNISPYINDLRSLNVRFVTLTVNAIDPHIGRNIYAWIQIEGRLLQGIEAAGALISKQLEALSLLKASGFTVKVNTVVIPAINENHILFLARKLGTMKIDLMNLLPIIPLPGTALEFISPPDENRIAQQRIRANQYVAQMHHCSRCRSDAAGKLHAFSVL